MILKKTFVLLLIALSLLACNTTKIINNPEEEIFESVFLDTLDVNSNWTNENGEKEDDINNLPVYHNSQTRVWDLLHTKLEVSFDWENQYLMGIATLTLKPIFYTQNKLVLDAKGFEILKIKNMQNNQDLVYNYDGKKIEILLKKDYSRKENIKIKIEYIAKPNEAPVGGSAAITSDKGLFFINPLNTDTDKPQQIWTQGETEASSKWFPTIDAPNERCTQEIYIKVQDKYTTLSNGLLISSQQNKDGTRTDYWKMDQAHAPYLFMMAIGEFVKIDDQWSNVPLSYYVEPKYKSDARNIFNHTAEMLAFFSEFTGVKYPWSKYAQVVVRDYVSGAMENTTAVIFGEFVQKTSKELLDYNNDLIVAHEMFHHWFGDYVTCESWSNLTLNEGFANYAEYLWLEHKYGRKAADNHKNNELSAYIASNYGGGHDLIDYEYDQKEDMFDAHSYNKGGLILHMLRNYVGDEAFSAGLKKYLEDNAYAAVEADNLRLAFESITGEDLNWFFNQWFYHEGHPELEIEKTYLEAENKFILYVDQIQDYNSALEIYRLPIHLNFIYKDGKTEEKLIWLDQKNQTFEFDIKDDLKCVVFDKNDILLAIIKENKTDEELYYEFLYNNTYKSKINGLDINDRKLLKIVLDQAINDEAEEIRREAVGELYLFPTSSTAKLEQLIRNDKSSKVRRSALESLNEINPIKSSLIAESILEKEQSYIVILEALNVIGKRKPTYILKKAESLQNDKAESIKSKIAEIFSVYGNEKHISFFKKSIQTSSKYEVFPLYNYLQKLLLRLDNHKMMLCNDFLIQEAKNKNSNPIKRFLATKTISILKDELIQKNQSGTDEFMTIKIQELKQAIIDIKASETNEKIKIMYQGI